MGSCLEIINSDVFILRPYSELDVRLKIDSQKNEQVSIYYKLVDCRNFKDDGSNDLVFMGSVVIAVSFSPSLTLRAPEQSGDYRLWVSLTPDFIEARAVRVIVSVTKVEVSPEIALFKDESELLAGIFFLYDKVSVKKLLYNKSSEYKLFFCQAQPSLSHNSGFSYHIIKIGFKHFLKLEIIGLNKLTSHGVEGFSEVADFIFKDDFGVILLRFNGVTLKSECVNLVEYIESKSKIEIIAAIKNFLIENLASNFYDEHSESKDTLINEYESLFFGGKVFGLFSYQPNVKIDGGGLTKSFKIEGENRSTIFETHKFKGSVEKVYDRSMVVLAKGAGSILERSYFIFNPVIKKERLAKLINSVEYDFEIKSAAPLLIEDFYAALLNKTFSENKEIANLIKKNEIINFLKVIKNEKRGYKTSFSVGGLNPREMYVSDNKQILMTSFDDVKPCRHILFDFALFETYLKINGAYNLMIKNNLPAKAADEFEDALEGLAERLRPCFAPYLAAIETIRECARAFFYKPGEAGEYYTALFIVEIGLLKNYYVNAQSKIAHFIFRAADKRARAILDGTIRAGKLYNGAFAAAPSAAPEKPAASPAKTPDMLKTPDIDGGAAGNSDNKNGARGAVKNSLRRAARNFSTLENYNLYLVCLSEPYSGKEFPIQRGSTTFGRSRNCDICLRDSPFISANHAIVEASDVSVKIKDLQSTNGTFVNGDKINEKVIHEECEVKFGDLIFKLEFRAKNKK